ncbi:MAG: helix-turn-helix domain-containing protein [Oscillospiraceae bacterium]|nr:helix-turn-helix domain-containing protein [Oscillospiraceae bacterium]
MQVMNDYIRPLIYIEHRLDRDPKNRSFLMHVHNVNEILYFISGDATYMVEGTEYKLVPGCIMFMTHGEAHMLKIRSSVPYERIVLQFADNYFSEADPGGKLLDILKQKPLGVCNYFEPDSDFRTYMLNAGRKPFENDEALNMLNTKANLTAILALLAEKYRNKSKIVQDEDRNSIRAIIEYINTNLYTDMTLDSICAAFFVNKSQINRYFKEVTGSTVWEYVIIKRLVAAKQLIKDGVKAAAAAEMTGFHDYSNFYRAYKAHFGISPKSDGKR